MSSFVYYFAYYYSELRGLRRLNKLHDIHVVQKLVRNWYYSKPEYSHNTEAEDSNIYLGLIYAKNGSYDEE